jgi:hypothetical protein
MSAPFKMKHQGSPFNMFGGTKSSPAKFGFWKAMKDMFSKGNAGGDDLSGAEGDMGESLVEGGEGTVPQHGPESHSRGGMGRRRGFLGGLFGGGGGGNLGASKWFQRG